MSPVLDQFREFLLSHGVLDEYCTCVVDPNTYINNNSSFLMSKTDSLLGNAFNWGLANDTIGKPIRWSNLSSLWIDTMNQSVLIGVATREELVAILRKSNKKRRIVESLNKYKGAMYAKGIFQTT